MTTSRDVARHWISVYQELLDFEQEMVATMERRVNRLSEIARRDAQRTNLAALQSDCARYQQRLTLWKERLSRIQQRTGGQWT